MATSFRALLLCALALLLPAAHGRGRLRAPKKVPPFRHVESYTATPTSDPPEDVEHAMAATMDLVFEADGLAFELDLELYPHVFGEGVTLALDEDGKQVELPRRNCHYTGTVVVMVKDAMRTEMGSASVSFYKDGTFRAVLATEEDEYLVDKLTVHRNAGAFEGEHASELLGQDFGHNMALTRTSELVPHEDDTSHGPGPFENKFWRHHAQHGRRLLVTRWNNCFSNQWSFVHELFIGIVTDPSYNSVYGSDAEDIQTSIGNLFTSASGAASNTIYEAQMNVRLSAGTLIIDGSTGLSTSSSSSINTRLTDLSSWRNSYFSSNSNEKNGLWHLLTNNHAPPGTVGLAYVGSICSYQYGTGVNNYIRDSWGGTWKTFAHEVGHNFGGSHSFENGQGSTGGIMDYGDGLYNGEYQFHPYRESEVCAQISESKSSGGWRKIPVDQCWHQAGNSPGPAPTPNPSPPPTKRPTPRPTNPPTPRPTNRPTQGGNTGPSPTSKPTDRPTPRPTGRPTNRPTARPVDGASDKGYFWYKYSGSYGACYPDCGDNSYKTEIVRCWEYTYSTKSWELADDSQCDAGSRPTPDTQQCTVAADGIEASCDDAAVCGNGQVEFGEVCDGDTCCKSDCSGYDDSSISCWEQNGVIDAIFQDYGGKVYVFQGPYYARYSSYTYGSRYNTPDSGFPKSIANSFPVSSFTQVTAAAYLSDEEVFLFNGMQYVKLSMTGGEYQGPRSVTQDWNVPAAFQTCGKVTGAIALSYYQMWFCDAIYGYVHESWDLSSYISSITNFGNSRTAITGVYNWPGSNSIYLFGIDSSGNAARRRLQSEGGVSQGIFVNSDINDLAEVDNSCSSENCLQCSDDLEICESCADGFYREQHACIDNDILLYLEFNSTIDLSFLAGGKQQLQGKTFVDGAMEFTGTTELSLLQPAALGDGEVLEEFMIGARFQPSSLTEGDVFMTMDGGVAALSFTEEDVQEQGEFRLKLKYGSQEYLTPLNTTIRANAWCTFEIGYTQDMFVSIINGDSKVVAFQTLFADETVELTLTPWTLGDSSQGVAGLLDEVYLTKKVVGLRLSPTFDLPVTDDDGDSDDGWVVPVVIVCVVLALCALGGMAYLWGRRKSEHSAHGRGLTGAPSAPSRGGLATQGYQPPAQVEPM